MNNTYLEIFSRLKRPCRFICKNFIYIIWFLYHFIISYEIISTHTRFISNKAAFIFCLIIYAASIIIAFSFGERILKLIKGARPIETKEEKGYLLPLFNCIYEETKSIYPDLPDIRLYIIDSMSINVFAIGFHTVAVTKGAVDTFSEDELKGVILHEMAHIYNGNTKAELLNTIGNGFVTIFVIFIDTILSILDYMIGSIDDIDVTHASGALRTLIAVIRFAAKANIYISLLVGDIILSGNSRKNELNADRFAFTVGYGEELTSALYLLQKLSLTEDMSLVQKLGQKHPRISKRIAILENLAEIEQESARAY